MTRFDWLPARRTRRAAAALVIIGLSSGVQYGLPRAEGRGSSDPPPPNTIPNNTPHRNFFGHAATFSTLGDMDLNGPYFRPQGTNGRSCATCHLPEQAWSITPEMVQRLFGKTGGTHPIFNPLDANNTRLPDATEEQRLAKYSMMLERGLFRRGGAPRAERDWDLVAVDDPHGFANLDRLVHWRRVLPTINFALGNAVVNWDGGNSVGNDQHAGLINQAARNVTGGQQGPPAPPEVIANIVAFEESLSTAQISVLGVGRLDADGARGGPEALSGMQKADGRFDIFDAWLGSSNPKRAQIARGQEIFNNTNAGGGRCSSCHNSANDGSSVSGRMFDIGTASAEARFPGLTLHTFRRRSNGETRQLTDAGQGNVTGAWADLGKFKTPTLRGLSARAPYFHNGSAETLDDVITHYVNFLGFTFTRQERADLFAFLSAL
jgi:cytochrome c peroxidase